MTANVDAMVRAGVDAYRAGNKQEARTLLERAIDLDNYNETAWLWLSAVVDTQEEQQTCLENVLVINPQNERARQGLKSMGIDPDTIVQQEEETSDDLFEEDDYDEYAVPSSSASVDHTESQTSAADYDDWVDGLNLGGSTQETPSEEIAEDNMSTDLFGDIDFSADDTAFGLDDNIFAEESFETYEDDASSYDTGYVEDELFAEDEPFVEDDIFIEDELFAEDDDGDDMYADRATYEAFNDAVETVDDYDASLFDKDPYAPEPVADDEYAPYVSMDALFAQIPAGITATRLPGVSEPTPRIHYILLGILVLANIGGIAFIGLQFIG